MRRRLHQPIAGRRGFSLLEALLVVAIIALLAGLVVPRLGGMTRREEQLVADRVADLMTMFAFRAAAGTRPVGLLHDPDAGRLELLIFDIDAADPEGAEVWQPDRLSMPVLLPERMRIVDAMQDRATLPSSAWLVSSKPGGERPRVSWRLEGDAIEVEMTLEPHALHASRSDRTPESGGRTPRDLDREGEERSPW